MKLCSYLSVFSIKTAYKIMQIFFSKCLQLWPKEILANCQKESYGTSSSMEVCPKSHKATRYQRMMVFVYYWFFLNWLKDATGPEWSRGRSRGYLTDRQGGVNTFLLDRLWMFTNASPCPWQAGGYQDHLSTPGNCPRKRIHEHSESIQEKQQLATHLEKEKGFLGAKRAELLSSGEI